jgi:hypothetical protein
MKPKVYFLLLVILGVAVGVHSQPISPPSVVGKNKILKMAADLTNGMPEQVVNMILTNQNFRSRSIFSETNGRNYDYEFSDGWLEIRCKDGFLNAVNIRWYTPLRLKIKLPDSWRQASNDASFPSNINSGNSAKFYRGQSDNALYVYWSESYGLVKASTNDLKDSLVRHGLWNYTNVRANSNELLNASCGLCAFGIYGTAAFHSAALPRSQYWLITDEKYYSIEGIYNCEKEPDPAEVREVQEIMNTVAVAPESPK